MPPISGSQDIRQYLEDLIQSNKVLLFSTTTCPFCAKVKALFESLNIKPFVIELNVVDNGTELRQALSAKVGRTSVPQVFINGQHIGGCDDTHKARDDGVLSQLLKNHNYDYDLIVIGGGSGGLAASKEAIKYGKKVAVMDYIVPTPLGTTWGLGGTCLNVGCIPKKLMHTAALIGQTLKDGINFGWDIPENVNHNWDRMKDEIQNYIRSSNFKNRVDLRQKSVDYINSYASFVDPHKIKCIDKKGNETFLTADKFIIATGERPRYPTDCVGANKYSITSDDLFSLPYNPGKTLVVGASYVALECAGFMRGIGLDVTVMVRSILLRGFDQEMAEKVGDYMGIEGIKFLRPFIPTSIEQIEAGTPGRLRVTAKRTDTNEEIVDEYNTVLFAIGRDPCTDKIGLENTGVVKEKNGKIKTISEKTNIDHIYAVGDILYGKLELTPVAIEAGVLLARRMFGNSTVECDYVNVPTTVFTPLEYGSCGYSEELAIQEFGEDNIDVYIQNHWPLEWRVAHRPENSCFAKLIVLRSENERILGFHYLGPNAGEVTQLVGLPLKMKATKADLDALIGIHPTCAEVFTTLVVTKRSGLSADTKGC
ncbi:thioredoxin reductase 1, cytoplasmic-like [Oppia nitens]|uniref:thioredoxin reductase 1, cytoplasmic-like n=1 Tax=Oppia nitens TaxID=1686743 RepID=UPI0023DA574E|nr:thioredoxin reductase 1, cytoplasmic-like [Oppia nitens]